MKKYYKILHNIFRSFSTPLFSFTLSILGIRLFGKENWGDFIYVWTIINFFTFLGNFGNKDFLLRKFSANPSKIIQYFSVSFSSRIVVLSFSLLLFFIVNPITALYSIVLIIAIFTYQSLESLIIYHQKFLAQLYAEFFGFAMICILFLNDFKFTLPFLITTYIASYFLKIITIAFALKSELKFFKFYFSINELKKSFPFFLIILSSWIASKIDLYVVNFKLNNAQIAKYQLAITAFFLLQSLSYLIIVPFNKHLYRLPSSAIHKIKIKLGYISVPTIVVGTLIIWAILKYIALLNVSTFFYIFGGLASLPIFFYVIDIMLCYRNKKENKILKINVISAVINVALTYYLIDFYGITGAIATVFISQLVILTFYKFNIIK